MTSESETTTIKSNLDMDLYVRSRTTNYFRGKAKSVTSINDTGIFDVLPLHANFIALIKDYLIVDKGYTTEKRIEFKTAVSSVIGGKMDVYVGA